MCTLVVAAHVFEGHPLVVVANRDEHLERASSPPSIWPGGFLAPRDEVAGGTWLGVNRAGVFVAITNRYLGPQDPARVSRGALVVEALALGSARAIHDALATVPATRHNGFHLVYADAQDVLATVSSGSHVAQLQLGRGMHVITERSFGAGDDTRRLGRIREAWTRIVGSRTASAGAPAPALDLEALSRLLTDHDEGDPLGATCIHLPGIPYGTRSGAVLAIAPARGAEAETRMLWAEGPPCTTPFAPVSGPGETR
jgi:uncharacterized protein with NRDE domain